MWDAIAYSFPNFNLQQLKLGNRSLNSSHTLLGIWLLIHVGLKPLHVRKWPLVYCYTFYLKRHTEPIETHVKQISMTIHRTLDLLFIIVVWWRSILTYFPLGVVAVISKVLFWVNVTKSRTSWLFPICSCILTMRVVLSAPKDKVRKFELDKPSQKLASIQPTWHMLVKGAKGIEPGCLKYPLLI